MTPFAAMRFRKNSLDPYTTSYVHMEGANNSTSFLDKAGTVWTAGADAKISTARSKFRSSSGLFDGLLDRVYTPMTAAVQLLQTTALTLDGWFYIAGNSAVEGGSATACLWAMNIPASGSFVSCAVVEILGNGTTTGTGLALEFWDSVGTTTNVYASMTITQNAWHYFQIKRSATNVWTIWLDGVSYTLTNNTLTSRIYTLGAGECSIGATTNTTFKRQLVGNLSEMRISKGIERPSTVPTGVLEAI
jgi:hypothetical protein